MSEIFIGGYNYVWQGKEISQSRNSSLSIATMPRNNSIIYTQCAVVPDGMYKIIITAARTKVRASGNCNIMTNFYAGKNYDGNQASVTITSNQMRDYEVFLQAPKAPQNAKIYFRIWRPNEPVNEILIQSVKITESNRDSNLDIPTSIDSQEFNNILKHFEETRETRHIDISFISCICNTEQYKNMVVSSLTKNKTLKQYDIIPIYNFENQYSAAQALNIGMEKAKSDIVVLCHQDVGFPENWIDKLYERILQVEKITKNWGVIGTNGVSPRWEKFGLAYDRNGKVVWRFGKEEMGVCAMQTMDEPCIITKKSLGLKFDEKLDGFHFYGADLCLESLNRGFVNYAIWNPVCHDFQGRSLTCGKNDYMRQLDILAKKWGNKFEIISTDTAIIEKGKSRTFVEDKSFINATKFYKNFILSSPDTNSESDIIVSDYKKLPIVIWTPGFDEESGGCIVLRKLCQMLIEKGEEAYLFVSGNLSAEKSINLKNIPVANGIIDPKNSIVVYPEIISGNPLLAKGVVRWILYTPGMLGRPPLAPAPDDIVVYYAQRFLPSAGPLGQLCVFELQDERFNFVEENVSRTGGCFLNRKGSNRPRIPETAKCVEIKNTNLDSIIPIFRSKKVFYSYDIATVTSLHAAMCGCISVVVPDKNITAAQYRRELPMFKYGVAYGVDDEEINYAIATQHLVKDHLKAIEQEGYRQLDVLLYKLEKIRKI